MIIQVNGIFPLDIKMYTVITNVRCNAVFSTKREAKRAEAIFLNDVNEGYSDSKTFDYVFHHYLENSDLRPKTKRRKQNEYHKHFKAKFGHIK